MISKSRVTILVKASPQPSKKHSETVCCAGIDDSGNWRRLFPIRFRQLSGEKAFKRWDILTFSFRKPTDDNRTESCRVHEESIEVSGYVRRTEERSAIIERTLVSSEKEAIALGHSLAVIRPKNASLSWKKRSEVELKLAKESFEAQASQLSFLDKELKAYIPCPYKFSMNYLDEGGEHNKTCADWETDATFLKLSKRYDEPTALIHLQETYCDHYAISGLIFALGNMKKRPQTWQLLGIFPAKIPDQQTLAL